MSSKSDNLTAEVAELLHRTDSLLSRPSAGGRSSLANLRSPSSGRLSYQGAASDRRGGLLRTASFRSNADVEGGDLLDAAGRLRGSFDAASRKLSSIKRSSGLTKSHSSDFFRRKLSSVYGDSPTQRLTDSVEVGRESSVVFTDPSTTGCEQNFESLASSLPGGSSGVGRTYNSFGGLRDLVSMVDDVVGCTSPRQAATGSSGAGTRGPVGSVSFAKLPSSSSRPLSRLSSPSLSPRSPLHKGSGAAAGVVPPASPTARTSRRSQLVGLLSKEVAQPYEVAKFKTEMKGSAQFTADVTDLAGSLQEKFDRINRKLKNWNLVETAATERFNTAMDAALEAIFSRVSLAWPSSGASVDAPTLARGAGAGAQVSDYYKCSSRGRRNGSPKKSQSTEGGRNGLAEEDSDAHSDISSESDYESPTSSASRPCSSREPRAAGLGTQAGRRRDSDSEASARSLRREDSRASRGKSRDTSSAASRRRARSRPRADVLAGANGEAHVNAGTATATPHTSGYGAYQLHWGASGSRGAVAQGALPAYLAVSREGPNSALYSSNTAAVGPSLLQHPPASDNSRASAAAAAASARAFYPPTAYSSLGGPAYTTAFAETSVAAGAVNRASGVVPGLAASYSYLTAPAAFGNAVQLPSQGSASPAALAGLQQRGNPWKPGAQPENTGNVSLRLASPGIWAKPDQDTMMLAGAVPMFQTIRDDSTIYRPQPQPEASAVPQVAPTPSSHFAAYSVTSSPAPGVAGSKAAVRVLWPGPPATTTAPFMVQGKVDGAGASGYMEDARAGGAYPQLATTTTAAVGGTGMNLYHLGGTDTGAPGVQLMPGTSFVTYGLMG